jgi:hypothetical protein
MREDRAFTAWTPNRVLRKNKNTKSVAIESG